MPAKRSDCRFAFRVQAAVSLIGLAATWVLWRFPPERYGFYPVCPVREYLHISCPGCGGTRAIAALLQGHLAEALRLNALIVGVILPLGGLYAAAAVVRLIRYRGGNDPRWPQPPRAASFALLSLTAVFTVARNF